MNRVPAFHQPVNDYTILHFDSQFQCALKLGKGMIHTHKGNMMKDKCHIDK